VPSTSPPAAAEVPAAGTITCVCDGSKVFAVEYGVENEEQMVRLDAEGRGMTMQMCDPSARGLRYAWPSDGSFPVWQLASGQSTPNYRDRAHGTTTPLLTHCRA